jgi:hypothetical protein
MPIVIAWLMEKIGSKLVLVGLQFAGATAFVVAHALVLGFVLYALKFVYNQYNAFMAFVPTMQGSDALSNMVINFLYAIGFFNAFNDVFFIFSPFLTAFLTYKYLMAAFHVSRALSNEFFKIGVLWQQ